MLHFCMCIPLDFLNHKNSVSPQTVCDFTRKSSWTHTRNSHNEAHGNRKLRRQKLKTHKRKKQNQGQTGSVFTPTLSSFLSQDHVPWGLVSFPISFVILREQCGLWRDFLCCIFRLVQPLHPFLWLFARVSVFLSVRGGGVVHVLDQVLSRNCSCIQRYDIRRESVFQNVYWYMHPWDWPARDVYFLLPLQRGRFLPQIPLWFHNQRELFGFRQWWYYLAFTWAGLYGIVRKSLFFTKE